MKNDEKKKTKKYIVILLLALLLLIAIGVVSIILIGKKDSTKKPTGGGENVVQDDEPEEPKEEVKPENPVPEVSEPEDTGKKPSGNTSGSKPGTNTPTEKPEVPPVKSDPNAILSMSLANLASLKGNSKEVTSISNPAKLNIEVGDTESVENAVAQIVNAIKSKVGYNAATADGNVPVGNPNPFSYDYRLIYTTSVNGKHCYTFEYRFRQYYNVAEKGYDTNRLVSDVVAYLSGQGKTKFDYQTTGTISESQPVIIPIGDDYNTALEKAKGQVASVCSSYRNFDFTYRALTIAGRGQTETTALMFYIYCK